MHAQAVAVHRIFCGWFVAGLSPAPYAWLRHALRSGPDMIAILSDIHGNRPALEAVFAEMGKVGC
jgi:hypothetical protein